MLLIVCLFFCQLTLIAVADLGERPGGPGPPLFWVKKEEMTEGRKPTGQVKQDRRPPPPPPLLAQSLDPPLDRCIKRTENDQAAPLALNKSNHNWRLLYDSTWLGDLILSFFLSFS